MEFNIHSRIKLLINDKKIRFLLVGGINTFVGYGSFAFFIFINLHYFIAQLLSTIIGVVNSYIWNKYYTFRSIRLSFWEMIRFLTVYSISYLLNMALLFILISKMGVSAYIAGAVGLAITTIISYLGHNMFSFKQSV